MTDTPSVPTEEDLDHVLQRSRRLYLALHSILGESIFVENRRDLLTQGSCSVAIEHGMIVPPL